VPLASVLNEVKEICCDPVCSYIYAADVSEFWQPVMLPRTITLDERIRRENWPWPLSGDDDGTILVSASVPPQLPPTAPSVVTERETIDRPRPDTLRRRHSR
jgi:hypothetical protein